MKNLQEKLNTVNNYMTNLHKFGPKFWENLKSTQLKNKSEECISDVDNLIEELIDNGEENFKTIY